MSKGVEHSFGVPPSDVACSSEDTSDVERR